MTEDKVKANSITIEIFNSGAYEDDADELQLAINGWLKNQPDNIRLEKIIYKHTGRNSKGKDIISVAILTSAA